MASELDTSFKTIWTMIMVRTTSSTRSPMVLPQNRRTGKVIDALLSSLGPELVITAIPSSRIEKFSLWRVATNDKMIGCFPSPKIQLITPFKRSHVFPIPDHSSFCWHLLYGSNFAFFSSEERPKSLRKCSFRRSSRSM